MVSSVEIILEIHDFLVDRTPFQSEMRRNEEKIIRWKAIGMKIRNFFFFCLFRVELHDFPLTKWN